LSIINGSTVEIVLEQGNYNREIKICSPTIALQNSQLLISNYGNAQLVIETAAIGLSAQSKLKVLAEKKENQIKFSMNGNFSTPVNDVFTAQQKIQGFNFISADENSSIEMAGAHIDSSIVRISQTVNIGDIWISLDRDVSGKWFTGDRIALGPTGFFFDEAESFTIVEVTGNRIKLSSAAKFMHYGKLQFFNASWKNFTLDERAEVALLTRNIQIVPKNLALIGKGPQVVASRSSSLNLQYIEIDFGGHLEQLGRYPIHFHRVWNTPGQIVRGCSITRSKNRCITIHSTNNVLIEENVCFDIIGHAFSWKTQLKLEIPFLEIWACLFSQEIFFPRIRSLPHFGLLTQTTVLLVILHQDVGILVTGIWQIPNP
jgi:hypothetical protein